MYCLAARNRLRHSPATLPTSTSVPSSEPPALCRPSWADDRRRGYPPDQWPRHRARACRWPAPRLAERAEMEPRLFDAHCHLDLMAHPDAVADEATRWAWVYLIAASIHATSLAHTGEPVAFLPSSRASAPSLVARRRPLRSRRSQSALRSCCPRALHRRSRARLFRALCWK